MAFLRDLAYEYPSKRRNLIEILLQGFVYLIVTIDGIIFVFKLYCGLQESLTHPV